MPSQESKNFYFLMICKIRGEEKIMVWYKTSIILISWKYNFKEKRFYANFVKENINFLGAWNIWILNKKKGDSSALDVWGCLYLGLQWRNFDTDSICACARVEITTLLHHAHRWPFPEIYGQNNLGKFLSQVIHVHLFPRRKKVELFFFINTIENYVFFVWDVLFYQEQFQKKKKKSKVR